MGKNQNNTPSEDILKASGLAKHKTATRPPKDVKNKEAYCGSIKHKVEKMDEQMSITKQFKKYMAKYHPASDQVTKQSMGGQGVKTPPRPGLVWNSQTHRWIRPKKYSMPNIKGKYMNTLLGSGKIISVKPLTEFFKPGYFEATLANGSKQSGTRAELERMSRT